MLRTYIILDEEITHCSRRNDTGERLTLLQSKSLGPYKIQIRILYYDPIVHSEGVEPSELADGHRYSLPTGPAARRNVERHATAK